MPNCEDCWNYNYDEETDEYFEKYGVAYGDAYEDPASIGVIGGADGPTEVFVTAG